MGKKGTAARMAKTKKILAQYGLTQAGEQHNPAPERRVLESQGDFDFNSPRFTQGGILPGEPNPSPLGRRIAAQRLGQLPRGKRRPPDAPQSGSVGRIQGASPEDFDRLFPPPPGGRRRRLGGAPSPFAGGVSLQTRGQAKKKRRKGRRKRR